MYVIVWKDNKSWNEAIPDVLPCLPFPQVLNVGVTVLPVSCVYRQVMPNSLNANCRPIIWTAHAVHVPPALLRIDELCSSKEMGGADSSQIRRKTISIDLIKSVQTDATYSQLVQSMDPPLGSDLHYDDK